MTLEEIAQRNRAGDDFLAGASPRNDRPLNGRVHRLPGDNRPFIAKTNSVVLQRILAPWDFSPASNLGIERALALAHQCQAVLTVLHVIDIGAQSQIESAPEFMNRLWLDGSSQMSQLTQLLGVQLDVQLVLEQGLPWEIIVEKSAFFDLVVLGTSRLKRVKLFSQRTAERVIKKARCPVMVVNHHEQTSNDALERQL